MTDEAQIQAPGAAGASTGRTHLRLVTPTGVLILSAAADRETWLRARMRGIGSSDVASILGVGRRSPLFVYHIKTGEIMEDADDDELSMWGRLHEETVAREWARRNKSVVRRIGLVATAGIPWQMCTLDRLVVECPLDKTIRNRCAVEVKTRDKAVASKWKGGPPDDVEAQVRWQMIVNGFDHMHVACLIGGNDYRQYTVRADPHLHQDIAETAGKFWSLVQNRQPPPEGDNPMYDHLIELDNKLHPNRAGSKFLGTADGLQMFEWIRAYQQAASAATITKKLKEKAKYEILKLMGSQNDAVVADNELVLTYDEVDRQRRCDFAMLEERWPEAYQACVTQPRSRTLSIKWKPPKEETESE